MCLLQKFDDESKVSFEASFNLRGYFKRCFKQLLKNRQIDGYVLSEEEI